jgi:hypothetical protein
MTIPDRETIPEQSTGLCYSSIHMCVLMHTHVCICICTREGCCQELMLGGWTSVSHIPCESHDGILALSSRAATDTLGSQICKRQ